MTQDSNTAGATRRRRRVTPAHHKEQDQVASWNKLKINKWNRNGVLDILELILGSVEPDEGGLLHEKLYKVGSVANQAVEVGTLKVESEFMLVTAQ